MTHSDFIPRPDAAFETFFRNITDFVLDNTRARVTRVYQPFPALDSHPQNRSGHFRLEEEERGKRVFFAAHWINNTSQSDIESAFIP